MSQTVMLRQQQDFRFETGFGDGLPTLLADEGPPLLDRVLATFEAYCTVTQSVRAAIPVDVQVFDSLGARLK